MTNSTTIDGAPYFDPTKPHALVRDRKLAAVEYQQGRYYYNRSGHPIGVADFELIFPVKKVEVKPEGTVTQRVMGKAKEVLTIGRLREQVAAGVKRKPGRPRSVMPEDVVRAARENARVAAAEEVA